MKMKPLYTRRLAIAITCTCCLLGLQAQNLKTSYFMDGTMYRLQLNPALMPTTGYIAIPVLGSMNASVSSSSLGVNDVVKIFDNGNDFYTKDDFRKSLKSDNRLNLTSRTDILSAGFYSGKAFWSFNLGTRFDVGAKIPRSMFDYLNDAKQPDFRWENAAYEIGKEQLNLNAYTELGVGYARSITDKLTVGGKFKFLLGMVNLKLSVDNISMDANLPENTSEINAANYRQYHAKLNVRASLESSMKGLGYKNSADGYINDIKMDGFGVAGYGAGIDLGAAYKVTDDITVSASLLDLGFISWSANSGNVATATSDINYDGKNYSSAAAFAQDAQKFVDRVDGGDVLNYDMLQLKQEPGKARTTSLHSTLAVGGEYVMPNTKWLSFGVLSSTYFTQPSTLTEITLSANAHPKSWLNASLSYSILQSAGQSFGLAVKVGPLFVGTDYMYLGNNTKSVNAFFGLSIPLGGGNKHS